MAETKAEMQENLREVLNLMDVENEEERRERGAITKRLKELKSRDEDYHYRRELIRRAFAFLVEADK